MPEQHEPWGLNRDELQAIVMKNRVTLASAKKSPQAKPGVVSYDPVVEEQILLSMVTGLLNAIEANNQKLERDFKEMLDRRLGTP